MAYSFVVANKAARLRCRNHQTARLNIQLPKEKQNAYKKNTATQPKSQPTTKQTAEDRHEELYGEHRDQLSDEQLTELVEDICGKDYDEQAAAALVLLMDEVERAQFDRTSLQNISITVSRAAFKYTVSHSVAEKNLIASMRREFARREVVN